MINLDSIKNENNKEPNGKWPYIPDHPYRMLNLIKEHDNDNLIDNIYLHAKDLRKETMNF